MCLIFDTPDGLIPLRDANEIVGDRSQDTRPKSSMWRAIKSTNARGDFRRPRKTGGLCQLTALTRSTIFSHRLFEGRCLLRTIVCAVSCVAASWSRPATVRPLPPCRGSTFWSEVNDRKRQNQVSASSASTEMTAPALLEDSDFKYQDRACANQKLCDISIEHGQAPGREPGYSTPHAAATIHP